MPDRLAYSPEEAADLTGLTADEIRKLCRIGDLRARKVGQRWLIPAASLRKWIGVAA